MKTSIRRSQREHAATLAASVRRTLSQEAAGATAVETRPKRRGGVGKIAGGLVMLAALVVTAVVFLRPEGLPWFAPQAVAVFELVQGTVDIRTAGARYDDSGLLSFDVGAPIQAGTVIDTRTASARTALRLNGGASVRLDADSRVEVASASVLRLERGAVYIDAAAVGTAVEVRTTLGIVRDIGTQFEVRLTGESTAPALRVRVREGAVVLERESESHQADAGGELKVSDDGTLTRADVPVHGSHWDWVLGTAPVPDFEARPLRAFLDWITREGGWSLEFADPSLDDLAAETLVYGIHGLTPMDAAAVALRGSRLEYELDGGSFRVRQHSRE